MSIFDRVSRPSSPESRATHLDEGFIFGAIPCEIVDLNDPEKLGRIRVTSKLISENQALPNSNDGWAWVVEDFTEGNTTGGAHRLLRVGAQVICIAMMGDPNNLFLIGCIPSRVEPPHPSVDRHNEIYGSVTQNGVFTVKNDSNQSRVDAYPHGVTQLVDGAGNITQTTANSATLSLREDGTASVQNPQSYTTHSPEGEVTQGNQAGAKQTMAPKGEIDIISAAKSQLKLDGSKGSLEGPLDEISQLLQQGKALMGEIAPVLEKINAFARGIGLPEPGEFIGSGFKELRNQLQGLQGAIGKLPEATAIFERLASANPMAMGQLLGPQLDAIAPLQDFLPIAQKVFASQDPVAAIAQLLPQLPAGLRSQLTPQLTEQIMSEAIALRGQPERQTEALSSAALGAEFGRIQNIFGAGLGDKLADIRQILPGGEPPQDFLASLGTPLADGLAATDPFGAIGAAAGSAAQTPGNAFGAGLGSLPTESAATNLGAGLIAAGSGVTTILGDQSPAITPPTREERLATYQELTATGGYWNDPETTKLPLTRALYDQLPADLRDGFTPDDFAVAGAAMGQIESFIVEERENWSIETDPNFQVSDIPEDASYRAGAMGSALGSVLPNANAVDPNSPFFKADQTPEAAIGGAVGRITPDQFETNRQSQTDRPSILPANAPDEAKRLEQLLPDLLHGNLRPESILQAAAGQLPIDDQLQGLLGTAMKNLSGSLAGNLSAVTEKIGAIGPLTEVIGAIGKDQTEQALGGLAQILGKPELANLSSISVGGVNLGEALKGGKLPDVGAIASELLPKVFDSISKAIGPGMTKALEQFNGLLNGLPINHKGAIVEARQHVAEILTDLRERGAKMLVQKAIGALVGPMGKSGLFAGIGTAGIKTPFGELGLGEAGGALSTLGKMAMRSLEGSAPGMGGAGLELAKGAASLASFADAKGETKDAEVTVADGAIRLAADKGVFVGDTDLMALVNSLTAKIAALESLITAMQTPPSTGT